MTKHHLWIVFYLLCGLGFVLLAAHHPSALGIGVAFSWLLLVGGYVYLAFFWRHSG